MTYIGYYFDKKTKDIVLLQDTLALNTMDYSFASLIDKTFYHKQSNVLIGSIGTGLIFSLASFIDGEVYSTHDEALQGIVQAAQSGRILGQEILAEHPIQVTPEWSARLFVFGFDEQGEPKLSIVSFNSEDFSSIPIVNNYDEYLKKMTDNAWYTPVSIKNKFADIPKTVVSSHDKTFEMYLEAIDRLKSNLNDDAKNPDITSLVIASALYGHVSSCFVPISEGGVGAGVGGEFVEYRINSDRKYSEKTLFVFPDNNLHGIPDDVTRMRARDIINAETFDDLPSDYKRIIADFTDENEI